MMDVIDPHERDAEYLPVASPRPTPAGAPPRDGGREPLLRLRPLLFLTDNQTVTAALWPRRVSTLASHAQPDNCASSRERPLAVHFPMENETLSKFPGAFGKMKRNPQCRTGGVLNAILQELSDSYTCQRQVVACSTSSVEVVMAMLTERKKPQDWMNLILAVALFLSPWVMGFAGEFMPAWNAWILGVVIGALALATLTAFSEWEEWVNMVLGIWLVLAPWLLDFATNANAMWTHVVVGLLVAAISAWALWDERQNPHAEA